MELRENKKMDKELFKILQELKLSINSIDAINYDKKMEDIKFELTLYTELLKNMNDEMIKEDIKVILLNIITFGIYYKRNKFEYELLSELVNGATKNIESNINYLVEQLIECEYLKVTNINKKESMIKNRNQIDSFLTLMDKMKEEEKEKVLCYRVGNIYE